MLIGLNDIFTTVLMRCLLLSDVPHQPAISADLGCLLNCPGQRVRKQAVEVANAFEVPIAVDTSTKRPLASVQRLVLVAGLPTA